MTTIYIFSTGVDSIRTRGFRVQPSPSAYYLTDNSLINTDDQIPEELDTDWTYISLETIEQAKKGEI